MPFSLTATGLEADPLVKLAELLASSATFRAVTGAANAAAALAFIHYPEADDTTDTTETMPRAILQSGPDFTSAVIERPTYSNTGSLVMVLQFDVPRHEDSPHADGYWSNLMFGEATWPSATVATLKQRLLAFLHVLGAILTEMQTNSGQYPGAGADTYLIVTQIDRIAGPGVANAEEENGAEYFEVVYLITWEG